MVRLGLLAILSRLVLSVGGIVRVRVGTLGSIETVVGLAGPAGAFGLARDLEVVGVSGAPKPVEEQVTENPFINMVDVGVVINYISSRELFVLHLLVGESQHKSGHDIFIGQEATDLALDDGFFRDLTHSILERIPLGQNVVGTLFTNACLLLCGVLDHIGGMAILSQVMAEGYGNDTALEAGEHDGSGESSLHYGR